MKKILLTTVALLSMASASVFGMYGVYTDWIFFLTHGNQFRARLDQLGFTLGNDTIKGTFGFDNNSSYGGNAGDMLIKATTGAGTSGDEYDWIPSISMGIAYTSSLIGVGVGYNATLGPRKQKFNGKETSKMVQMAAHTPVLVLNALDNAFRMAIPIQVYVDNDKNSAGDKSSVTAVSVDSQFRYYTGLEMLPQVRLYLRYGSVAYNTNASGTTTKGKVMESFGFDFRFYFGSMVEEVALQPLVKLAYNGALGKYHNVTRVEAVKYMKSSYNNVAAVWEQGAWDLQLMLGLGLTANSDIVSLYLEPQLGLKVDQAGSDADKNVKEVYGLGYNVYAEIYITPLKNLEWYFETTIGNSLKTSASYGLVQLEATTGVTWYLPAL
ncbi:cell surface protein [Brachyspira sp.]|uniref:cell surface protein n=1 Tax=Brachyspira sp. TaxID=1977261 RepID=UPI003D7DEACA